MDIIKNIFHKTTKIESTENTSIIDKLMQKNITYDEAMNELTANLLCAGIVYYDQREKIKKSIESYNAECDGIIKTIEIESSNPKNENHSLNLLYLRTFKNEFRDDVEFVKNASWMTLTAATVAIRSIKTICKMGNIEYDRVAIANSIMKPEVRSIILNKFDGDLSIYNMPSPADRLSFVEMIENIHASMDGKEKSVENFINDNGLFIDENGTLLEYNIFKDFRHINYNNIV